MTRCASEKVPKKGPRCVIPIGHNGTHYNGSTFWTNRGIERGTGTGPDPRAQEWG